MFLCLFTGGAPTQLPKVGMPLVINSLVLLACYTQLDPQGLGTDLVDSHKPDTVTFTEAR